MGWFCSPYSLFSRKKAPTVTLAGEYSAAGCIFTDDIHVLAGYQPHKRKPFLSGFGGSREEGETPILTAVREAVEELYSIASVPTHVLLDIQIAIQPLQHIQQGGYHCFVYSFPALEILMSIVDRYRILSPVYSMLPRTIPELIFYRKVLESAEVSHLALLPVVKNHPVKSPFLDSLFLEDIRQLNLVVAD